MKLNDTSNLATNKQSVYTGGDDSIVEVGAGTLRSGFNSAEFKATLNVTTTAKVVVTDEEKNMNINYHQEDDP